MSTTPMSTEGTRRFCGHCGHEVGPQAGFCGTCGQTTAPPRPAPPPAAPASPPAAPTLPRAAQAPPPPPPPPPGAAGRAARRTWLIPAVVVLVLAAIAAPVVLVAHPFGRHGPAPGPIAAPATSRGGPAPPASPSYDQSALPLTAGPTATETVSEQQAVESLAALLARSVADRAAVDHAYDDVRSCGPDLSADTQVFQGAAASRQQLIDRLADLPSASALSAQMLGDLSDAWQASAAVDGDYAQWAQDEWSGTCVPDDPADPSYLAASSPNQQATQDKLAFSQQWNQLAAMYGLTQYDQSQL